MLLFIGFVFPMMGLYYYYTLQKTMQTGVVTKAKVIRMEKTWSMSRGTLTQLSYPVVVYQTKAGEELTVQLEYATSWETVRKGQTITIVYRPENPKVATVYMPVFPKVLLWGSILLFMVCLVLEWVM